MKKMSIFYPRYTVKKITRLTKSTVAQQSGKLSVFVLGKRGRHPLSSRVFTSRNATGISRASNISLEAKRRETLKTVVVDKTLK